MARGRQPPQVVLTAHSQGGALWGGAPVVQPDGGVLSVQHDTKRVRVTGVAWDRMVGGRVAVGNTRGEVHLFHLNRNRYTLVRRCGHGVAALAWSTVRRGELVVSLQNKTLAVLNVDTGGQAGHTLREHTNVARLLHYAAPPRAVVVSAASDSVAVWAAPYTTTAAKSTRYEVKYTLKTAACPAVAIATTPRHVITCHTDVLCLWELAGPCVAAEFALPVVPQQPQQQPLPPALPRFDTIAVSPDGRWLAAGGTGAPSVALYDLVKLKLVKVVQVVPDDRASTIVMGTTTGPGIKQLKFIPAVKDTSSGSDVTEGGSGSSSNRPTLAAVATDGQAYIARVLGSAAAELDCVIARPNMNIDAVDVSGCQYLSVTGEMVGFGGMQVDIVHLPTARLYSGFQSRRAAAGGGAEALVDTTVLASYVAASAAQQQQTFLAPADTTVSGRGGPRESCVAHPAPLAAAVPPPDAWIKSELLPGAPKDTFRRAAAEERRMMKELYDAPGGGGGATRTLSTRHGAANMGAISLRKNAVAKTKVMKKTLEGVGMQQKQAGATGECSAGEDGDGVDGDLKIQLQLDDKSLTLNTAKLRRMLMSYGQYPQKYRTLIWRFLLRLPGDASCFQTLLEKGAHPATPGLLKDFPLHCAKLKQSMTKVLDCLCHHCSAFAVTTWLPELVFPFAKTYGTNIKAAFETCLLWMRNWGRRHLDTYPHYSYRSVLLVEELLRVLAPDTLAVLRAKHCGVEQYAWSPMASVFTNILSAGEWAQVMDHVVSNQPVWFFLFHVAYLAYNTKAFEAAPAEPRFFDIFFSRNNPIKLNAVIQMAYAFQRKVDLASQDISAECEAPAYAELRVLDDGVPYPVLSDLPEVTIAAAVKERERILEQELHLARVKENTLAAQRLLDESEGAHERQLDAMQHRSSAAHLVFEQQNVERERLAAARDVIMEHHTGLRLRHLDLQQRTAKRGGELASTQQAEALGRLQQAQDIYDALARSTAMDLQQQDVLLAAEEHLQRRYEAVVRVGAQTLRPTTSADGDSTATAEGTHGDAAAGSGTPDEAPAGPAPTRLLDELNTTDKAVMTSPARQPGAPAAAEISMLRTERPAVVRRVLTPMATNITGGGGVSDEVFAVKATTAATTTTTTTTTAEEAEEHAAATADAATTTTPDPAVDALTRMVERELHANYQHQKDTMLKEIREGMVVKEGGAVSTETPSTTATTGTTATPVSSQEPSQSRSETTPTTSVTTPTTITRDEGNAHPLTGRQRDVDADADLVASGSERFEVSPPSVAKRAEGRGQQARVGVVVQPHTDSSVNATTAGGQTTTTTMTIDTQTQDSSGLSSLQSRRRIMEEHKHILKHMREKDDVFRKLQLKNQEEVAENERLMRKLETMAADLLHKTTLPPSVSIPAVASSVPPALGRGVGSQPPQHHKAFYPVRADPLAAVATGLGLPARRDPNASGDNLRTPAGMKTIAGTPGAATVPETSFAVSSLSGSSPGGGSMHVSGGAGMTHHRYHHTSITDAADARWGLECVNESLLSVHAGAVEVIDAATGTSSRSRSQTGSAGEQGGDTTSTSRELRSVGVNVTHITQQTSSPRKSGVGVGVGFSSDELTSIDAGPTQPFHNPFINDYTIETLSLERSRADDAEGEAGEGSEATLPAGSAQRSSVAAGADTTVSSSVPLLDLSLP